MMNKRKGRVFEVWFLSPDLLRRQMEVGPRLQMESSTRDAFGICAFLFPRLGHFYYFTARSSTKELVPVVFTDDHISFSVHLSYTWVWLPGSSELKKWSVATFASNFQRLSPSTGNERGSCNGSPMPSASGKIKVFRIRLRLTFVCIS
jgi:hypothetical protein